MFGIFTGQQVLPGCAFSDNWLSVSVVWACCLMNASNIQSQRRNPSLPRGDARLRGTLPRFSTFSCPSQLCEPHSASIAEEKIVTLLFCVSRVVFLYIALV